MPATYDDFFRTATATKDNAKGNTPHDYQCRLACGEPMELGLCTEKPFENQPSWAERMLALRDDKDVGPLRLPYWATLLGAADERAAAKNHRTILA